MDLYELSDKWLLEELSKDCCQFLRRSLNVRDFAEIAQRADEIRAEDLCDALADFAVNNYEELEEKDLEKTPHSILRRIIYKSKPFMRKGKFIKISLE